MLWASYTQAYDYTSPNNTYDAAGRLQRCAVGSTVLTYTYDNAGNRTQETVGGTTNSFGYTSGTNKISSATINGTSYTYTHDNTGNITIKSWGGGEYHLFYSYDYKNMLVSVNNDVTNRTVTNYYGGGGSQRIKKTDSQLGSRYYAYEGINPLCEYDSTGTVKKKYVYAFGRCIAYVDSAGNKFWLHQDALGSVKVVTNINGDTVSTYKYYPFGDSLLTRGTSKNDVQFTGKQNIAGIEAYDFSARYYDPELGRFYSIDPMGSAATSPYAYCSNDPVNRVDPTGMVDQSAGYPKGWTDFRYNRWEAWDMFLNRGRSAIQPGDEEIGIVFIDCDQWGNVINRIYCGWGVDPAVENGNWSAQQAEPSYMWGSGDVTFDKSVSKTEQDKIMRRKYIESKYGGQEGRDAAAGIRGCTIKYEDLGPADYENGRKGYYDPNTKTIVINSQLGSDVNTMALMHESLHPAGYSDYGDLEMVINPCTGLATLRYPPYGSGNVFGAVTSIYRVTCFNAFIAFDRYSLWTYNKLRGYDPFEF